MTNAAPFGSYAPDGLVRQVVAATRRLPDTWTGRRMTILLRRLAMRRLKAAPVDVEALDIKMRLVPVGNICDKRMLFAPHTFDPQELRILGEHIRPGFVFIDVGANIGAYSLFVASRAGPSARVLAIEPQPAVFDRLVFNVGLNAFATVKAVACAVADKSGDVTLFLDGRNSGESSVKTVGGPGSRSVRVPARTLLELIVDEGFAHVDAVKLDVEGAEDLVLEPFFERAPEGLYPSLLILEDGAARWGADLPALLHARGYREIVRTRMNRVYVRPTERSREEGSET